MNQSGKLAAISQIAFVLREYGAPRDDVDREFVEECINLGDDSSIISALQDLTNSLK